MGGSDVASMLRSLALPTLVSLVLAGCGAQPQQTVAPVSYRSFKTDGKRTGTITADARMRNAYVGGGKVCAEPPPDVAANYALERAVSASVSLGIAYQAFSVDGKGEGQSAWKGVSDVADVTEKTEALLVVRESLYRLCELSLNTKIDKDTAVSIFRELLYTTRDLGRHDVLEQLVEAIEYAVGFQDTTVEMLAQLTQLAAHIATIETYQSALLTAGTLADADARSALLNALAVAMIQQLRVFPRPEATSAATAGLACTTDKLCELSSDVATELSLAALAQAAEAVFVTGKGWQLGVLPLVFGQAGFEAGDVITTIRLDAAAHDLSKLTQQGELSKLLWSLLASQPAEVQVELERAGTTQTLSFTLKS
ncbi:hypothetical protein ACNOYE_32415 [Nannocystaceae bacterium ST9]